MEPSPGDVVMLKSGGNAMTVVEVNDKVASCVWMGEEGDLFRETLPLAVLEIVELSEDDDEDDEDEDEADDEAAAESSKVA
jgi:uncharacterized protein YodC (DUF2158 family)|uniref:DUF2158 domain-containing protein n=1 Tax=Rhodopseudomonas palustris (strain BisA53) TaxID=316055 RepID=Q07T33_RHOP5